MQHRPPRGRLGARPGARRRGRSSRSRRSTPSTAAPSAADGRACERRAGAPVAFLANGSHAAYFRRGVRDRTFPDPNDEAEGRASASRPPLEVIGAADPGWMRFPGRWGSSRARWPAEQSSPRGPAFQGVRWDDPAAFAASARGCMAGRCDRRGECDGRELRAGRRRRSRCSGCSRCSASRGGAAGEREIGDAPAAIRAAGSHATCRSAPRGERRRERIRRPRLADLNARVAEKVRVSGRSGFLARSAWREDTHPAWTREPPRPSARAPDSAAELPAPAAAASGAAAHLLGLQRTIGNRRTAALVAGDVSAADLALQDPRPVQRRASGPRDADAARGQAGQAGARSQGRGPGRADVRLQHEARCPRRTRCSATTPLSPTGRTPSSSAAWSGRTIPRGCCSTTRATPTTTARAPCGTRTSARARRASSTP